MPLPKPTGTKAWGTAKINLVQIYRRGLRQTPVVFCRSSDTGSGTLETLSDVSTSARGEGVIEDDDDGLDIAVVRDDHDPITLIQTRVTDLQVGNDYLSAPKRLVLNWPIATQICFWGGEFPLEII
ncbi:unnamed protein product [Soboliphyme baturini]|uniref:Transthyretin-like family protein n=1 Tax=Soboliphyme baturini TaxID=241478 RepID=A0A183IEZ3_9BILA|nr:unnamed protein product [Soboliphyme baturini]